MASELFGQRFRRGVGDKNGLSGEGTPLFSNEEIDDYGLQADEDYPNASFNAKVAYAVVLGLTDLCALIAPDVSYEANAASEKLGEAFDHYSKLLKKWEEKLQALLDEVEVPVNWGSTVSTPLRDEEFPDA